MGVIILGVNTLYRLFCFFKLFLMVGKGLTQEVSFTWPHYCCFFNSLDEEPPYRSDILERAVAVDLLSRPKCVFILLLHT